MFADSQMMGTNLGFPDVCKTPVGPAIVPIPYPNISMKMMGVPAAYNILIGGAPGHNLLTITPISNGDNAGVLLGLISQTLMALTRPVTGSFTCLILGAPGTRMTSITIQNAINCPGFRPDPGNLKVVNMAP
jgi:hypothetical protein